MSSSYHVQTILNGTISSLKSVVPLELNVQPPSLMAQPFEQDEIGVLIGMIGDIKGRIIINSTEKVFGMIGQTMFGMAIEGEMLESFTGELGNMIAGNLCTIVESSDMKLDITPPTVMVGKTKFYGFTHAFKLPVHIDQAGTMNILLTIDEE